MKLSELVKQDKPCKVQWCDTVYHWTGTDLYYEDGITPALCRWPQLIDDVWTVYKSFDDLLKEYGYSYSYRAPYHHYFSKCETNFTITVKPSPKRLEEIFKCLM